MIDKVAAAIATFSTGSADNYKNYREEARAAIEAMREPTLEMRYSLPPRFKDMSFRDVGDIWKAMLSAALHGDQEG